MRIVALGPFGQSNSQSLRMKIKVKRMERKERMRMKRPTSPFGPRMDSNTGSSNKPFNTPSTTRAASTLKKYLQHTQHNTKSKLGSSTSEMVDCHN